MDLIVKIVLTVAIIALTCWCGWVTGTILNLMEN